jgi:hypothetical protein
MSLQAHVAVTQRSGRIWLSFFAFLEKKANSVNKVCVKQEK